MRSIPRGWTKFEPIGQCVTGTKMIAFKVPLKLEICSPGIPENEWFTPAILLQKQPQLKTIIDLTDTQRYYDPQEFESNGVTHIKISITGGGRLPPSFKMQQFFEAVDEFMEKYTDDSDALIGVHCTHGLNRTGYFICNYMVNRLKMSPEDAISRFESARGYAIERKIFVDNIKSIACSLLARRTESLRTNLKQYSSPLDDCYGEESRRGDLRNRSRVSLDKHRRAGTSVDHGRYGERSCQKSENWRIKNDDSSSNVNKDTRNVWKSSRTHPYGRNMDNKESKSSSSSRNCRKRP